MRLYILIAISLLSVAKHLEQYKGELFDNRKLVFVDKDENSPTYEKIFVEGDFYLLTNEAIILKKPKLQEFSIDNIINQDLVNSFQILQKIFGGITLRGKENKIYFTFEEPVCVEHVLSHASIFRNIRTFKYKENRNALCYVPNDRSMRTDVRYQDLMDVNFFHEHYTNAFDLDPNYLNSPSGDENSYFQLTDENIQINLNPNSYSWHIYSSNIPMAWDITTSKEDVVIGLDDQFNPDLDNRVHSELGNFRRYEVSDGTDNGPQAIAETNYLRGDRSIHGFQVTATAISGIDNDDPLNDNANPAVGVAPGSIAIGLQYWHPLLNYYDYDADGDSNGIRTNMHVVNISSAAPRGWNPANDIQNFQEGIVLVASGANKMQSNGNWRNLTRNPNFIYPNDVYPGAYTFQSSDSSLENDSHFDIKVICVGAVEPGWNTCPGGSELVYSGKERVKTNYNYSADVNKFPDPATFNNQQRIDAKRQAFIDIVAPTDFFQANDWADDLKNCTQTFGSLDYFECEVRTRPTIVNRSKISPWMRWFGDINDGLRAAVSGYTYKMGGTSSAAPIVSGTIALMMSLSDRLNVTGENVQRKAYNILTFTADKINNVDGNGDVDNDHRYTDVNGIDIGGIDYFFNPDSNQSGSPVQFNYVEQEHDRLKRWWSQNYGFGLLNSYRALAHTVENKAQYEFTDPRDDLAFAANLNGNTAGYSITNNNITTQFMHMGSHVSEGRGAVYPTTGFWEIPISRGPNNTDDGVLNVLDWGGSSIPEIMGFNNDAPWRVYEPWNNQGVTVFNNTNDRIFLDVDENEHLLIDGLLISTGRTGHQIRTNLQSTNGLISIEGYMRDMELAGNLRVGDLIIDGSAGQTPTGGLASCLWFGNENTESEIYGKISVLNNGIVMGAGGRVIFQTGSELELLSDNNTTLMDTSEWHFRGNSKVKIREWWQPRTTGDEIVIDGNSTLIIDESQSVKIDAIINVVNGELRIERNAIAEILEIRVGANGTLVIEDGVHLSLTSENQDWSGTIILENFDPENQTVITNRITGNHCKYDFIGHWLDNPTDTNITNNFRDDTVNIRTQDTLNVDGVTLYNVQSIHQDGVLNISNSKFFMNSSGVSSPKPLVNIVGGASINISSSTFINLDKNGDEIIRKQGIGVQAFESEQVNINGCFFMNLNIGIYSRYNQLIKVSSNTFVDMKFGQVDVTSAVSFCDNYLDDNEVGLALISSFSSLVYENEFVQVGYGVNSIGGSTHYVRSNLFGGYFTAINIIDSRLMLRGDKISGVSSSNDLINEIGRNIFKKRFQTIPYEKPFYHEVLAPNSIISDIKLNHKDAFLEVNCGKNEFSENSDYHIYYNKKDSSDPDFELKVNTNNWKNNVGNTPRTSGIFETNLYQLDLDENLVIGCKTREEYDCETRSKVFNQCESLKYWFYKENPHDLGFEEYKQWLKDNFSKFLKYIGNDTIPMLCVKEGSYYALQTALYDSTYADSIEIKLNDFFNSETLDLEAGSLNLGCSPWTQGFIMIAYQYNLAKGNYCNALRWLEAVYYHCWIDYLTHREYLEQKIAFLKMKCNEQSGNYSLSSQYYDEHIEKLNNTASLYLDFYPSRNKNELNNNNKLLNKVTIKYYPNPFKDKATFEINNSEKAQLKLSIYDGTGKEIAVLLDKVLNNGKHNITYNSENLKSGIYYFVLASKFGKISDKIVLVR